MGDGLLQPADEAFGVPAVLHFGQGVAQISHAGHLPKQRRGCAAQAAGDAVFGLAYRCLKQDAFFVVGQGFEGLSVRQPCINFVGRIERVHVFEAVDEDADVSVGQ